LKPYCFEVATKDKTYYIACKSDEDLYSWMDEIYNVRSMKKKKKKLDIIYKALTTCFVNRDPQ
jgi:hypothetical protein